MEEEFFVWQKTIGHYLRTARLQAAFSLRDVERESGVARSEIQRLESGGQDFRLISFLKLCAALGLPPASLLDQAVSCSTPYYAKRVEEDPLFKKELQTRGISPKTTKAETLSFYIGSLAAAAAHLLRCSSPSTIGGNARYPNSKMQSAFIAFSRKFEFEIEPLDRLGFIKGMRRLPIHELKLHGLWNEEYLNSSVTKPTPLFMLVPDDVPR